MTPERRNSRILWEHDRKDNVARKHKRAKKLEARKQKMNTDTDTVLLDWFDSLPRWKQTDIVNDNKHDTFREKLQWYYNNSPEFLNGAQRCAVRARVLEQVQEKTNERT